ncbi:MAG: proprotein convertase P-domain-containing protein [Chloroflexi bacterium]|nr:proprotein convertase P-domain-containing protein [Chloroflexota bacterium]
MSAFLGQPMRGDWTLHVQDLARRDVGRFNQWELTLVGQPDVVIHLEETPGINIPDNKPAGIERRLETAVTGNVQEVEVTLDITHSYIGDLVVGLTSPAGTNIPLHTRAGGSMTTLSQPIPRPRRPLCECCAISQLRGRGD